MKKNKIAIACQGGGSQTAFTAGVLRSFFENNIHKKKQIISLSGTSGGAVCAALAWYSLLKAAQGDSRPIEYRLMSFWQDNSTQNFYEEFLNDSMVKYVQLVNSGLIPEWKTSPDSPFVKTLFSLFTEMAPRKSFYDFKELLASYLDFQELEDQNLIGPSSPVLVIGAANVLSGEFVKFSSYQKIKPSDKIKKIRLESILASAAVPFIFSAAEIENQFYWDGLFSDNPPTDELLDPEIVGPDNKPDEIWIIQINPKIRENVPKTPAEIFDRRNEMIGNESLYQDLQKIELINKLISAKAFKEEYNKYKKIEVNIIEMSSEQQKSLEYSSKLDRNASHINKLIEDGQKQGKEFLKRKKLI